MMSRKPAPTVPGVLNLLTANQATGGDTLGDTTGFTTYGAGVSLAYSTLQQYEGAGSMSAAINAQTTAQGLEIVVPGGTIEGAGTFTFFLRAYVSAAIAFNFSAVNDWYGSMFTQTGGQAPGDGWVTYSATVTDIGTSSANNITHFRFYNFDAPRTSDLYVDTVGVWAGTSTDWEAPQ